ncbi:hypothetical protein GGTG_03103 [Gaeumannomyces tritici R3-111a-1]|uniref:Uncharacterized protein n=1 Tax=Gaeumannomyces tritici (strain R3-111a-1) TaxID=644352 RepID=J3NP97_GAET3|nr:hypothetical protein GGTG_03103 [Gaeumannomyces tritici R3-111a-1]EJT78000.1 hypothetical protein GGTG_03103 [Gaeumannomyces tritici R3-111a-1]
MTARWSALLAAANRNVYNSRGGEGGARSALEPLASRGRTGRSLLLLAKAQPKKRFFLCFPTQKLVLFDPRSGGLRGSSSSSSSGSSSVMSPLPTSPLDFE